MYKNAGWISWDEFFGTEGAGAKSRPRREAKPRTQAAGGGEAKAPRRGKVVRADLNSDKAKEWRRMRKMERTLLHEEQNFMLQKMIMPGWGSVFSPTCVGRDLVDLFCDLPG